jgi:hypothetical protein
LDYEIARSFTILIYRYVILLNHTTFLILQEAVNKPVEEQNLEEQSGE